ncbi:hypothetical protein OnM2_030070 [Erysiphe neolycopersici]|uniref:Uncharacterized protein n=1 Tax=Erysiphe neolycopersici TaxID=212602 RepID=A0A420HZI9_9PEZI|nr:hypothetical protein OnM2_030070 [Erysiphe neolycopersici]
MSLAISLDSNFHKTKGFVNILISKMLLLSIHEPHKCRSKFPIGNKLFDRRDEKKKSDTKLKVLFVTIS